MSDRDCDNCAHHSEGDCSERECSFEQKEDDTISRQAAIGAVSRGCQEFRGIFAECEKNLNELPSAQPEQSIAQERYEDLCEYFKDCSDQGRSILNDRKEFKSWLDRMKWHVMECNKLGRELEKIKTAQPEQRWIPCSETIDIPDHEVLCCDKYGEELIGWLSYNDDQWLCESDGEMMYDPIAWREKPEPYREESETDE